MSDPKDLVIEAYAGHGDSREEYPGEREEAFRTRVRGLRVGGGGGGLPAFLHFLKAREKIIPE